jgi:4-hydroxy-tetrahydrodipicolinate synthase
MTDAQRFHGSITALATPFTSDGRLDLQAFAALVDWQIREGSHGLVPAGTTGEASTLTHQEHRQLIQVCVEAADGRVPVIAGAGSNSTAEAIDLARDAQQLGADALLVVTPYYNRPTQHGLHLHFSMVAEATDLPVFIYNIPPRSVVDMTPLTMGALAGRHSNIVGVKDATGRLERVSEQRAACGPDFIQLSGEDATALGFHAHGGQGCISVTANVAPRLCAEFQESTRVGDYARARQLHERLHPLHQALFIEPGVCGVKYALSRLKRALNRVRAPLTSIEPSTQSAIDAALKQLGIGTDSG